MLRLSLSFLILASQISLMPAQLVQPDRPDPAALQPSLVFPTAPPTTTTIPAFPEQSAATAGGAACPLDLSDDLISGISASCSPLHGRHPSRSRCCPSLAAGLYSAYAASSLSAAAAGDLPALPDDSESCAASADRAVTGRGVALPRVNATCGAAYCYCGIRLRRLSCAFAAVGGGAQGRWAPRGGWARRLEKNCARHGLSGCSLCLRTLNQLKAAAAAAGGGDVSLKDGERVTPRGNDCQLIGLTWLLSRNRTRYLPTATAVIRAFMAAEGGAAISTGGVVGPTCRQTADDMPFAVGSSEIGDEGYAELSAAGELPPTLLLLLLLVAHFLLSVISDFRFVI